MSLAVALGKSKAEVEALSLSELNYWAAYSEWKAAHPDG